MRILVVSDTHGGARPLCRLYEKIGGDALVHAGDGAGDVAAFKRRFPAVPVQSVKGNCDGYGAEPQTLLFEMGGIKFFLAHGHTFSVKSNTALLAREARSVGAGVAIFGHTHRPICVYSDGLWLLNPGSLAMTEYGKICFANIDITGGQPVCSLASIDCEDL